MAQIIRLIGRPITKIKKIFLIWNNPETTWGNYNWKDKTPIEEEIING